MSELTEAVAHFRSLEERLSGRDRRALAKAKVKAKANFKAKAKELRGKAKPGYKMVFGKWVKVK